MVASVVYASEGDMLRIAVVDTEREVVTGTAVVNRNDMQRCMGTVHLNYSIRDGKCVEDVGSFSRLGNGIILKELCDGRGKILGYTYLVCSDLSIRNITKEAILSMDKTMDGILFQNAIIRGNAVNCYPNHPFEKKVIEIGKKKGWRTDGFYQEGKTGNGDKAITVKSHASQAVKNIQRKGFGKYIGNPALSDDVAQFLDESVVSEDIAKACKPIAMNPKLSRDQVEELYQCALKGIDYSGVCNENLTVNDMANFRKLQEMKNNGDLNGDAPRDELLIQKCLKVRQDIYQSRS